MFSFNKAKREQLNDSVGLKPERHITARRVASSLIGLVYVGVGAVVVFFPAADNNEVEAIVPKVDFDVSATYEDGRREYHIGDVTIRSVCDGLDMIETIETNIRSSEDVLGGASISSSAINTTAQRLVGYPGCLDGVLTAEDFPTLPDAPSIP